MHTEKGWLHTLKLKLHNTHTHSEHFLSLHIFYLQNTEWDKYVQNFIAQQNKFASASDNTTKPTDSGRFIYIYTYMYMYVLNKLKHKSLKSKGPR